MDDVSARMHSSWLVEDDSKGREASGCHTPAQHVLTSCIQVVHSLSLWQRRVRSWGCLLQVQQVLEFSSDRGRMSVIFRMEDGSIRLFAKGSDAKMLAIMSPSTPRDLLEATNKNLHLFATQASRYAVAAFTLVQYAPPGLVYLKACPTKAPFPPCSCSHCGPRQCPSKPQPGLCTGTCTHWCREPPNSVCPIHPCMLTLACLSKCRD